MYWRVNRYDPYQIDIGIFGRQQDVLITEDTYFISLDDITENYNDVINIGVVMSDKSDGGASSLTLRDIFYNKSLMIQGFPVIKTGRVVNSQRSFDYPQIPQFAPEIIGEEFALMDEEGIALEAGQLYWGTVTTNDIQAIAEDNKELTDDDRINATEQLYYSAIRKLKNSRRKVRTLMLSVSQLQRESENRLLFHTIMTLCFMTRLFLILHRLMLYRTTHTGSEPTYKSVPVL